MDDKTPLEIWRTVHWWTKHRTVQLFCNINYTHKLSCDHFIDMWYNNAPKPNRSAKKEKISAKLARKTKRKQQFLLFNAVDRLSKRDAYFWRVRSFYG